MDKELAIIEGLLAIGFVVFGYQRWQMGARAASVMCFMLATYFGRIALLYGGREWDQPGMERAIEPTAIFMNALLLFVSLLVAIGEAHEQGFAEWRRRWKERHK